MLKLGRQAVLSPGTPAMSAPGVGCQQIERAREPLLWSDTELDESGRFVGNPDVSRRAAGMAEPTRLTPSGPPHDAAILPLGTESGIINPSNRSSGGCLLSGNLHCVSPLQ